MQRSDFHFDLPPSLIAQHPLAERSASRLLTLDGASGALTDRHFRDLCSLLEPGDLLVFNDTKVIPARLFGRKKTGGEAELLVERILDNQRILAQIRVSKSPQVGDSLFFPHDIALEIIGRQGQF